MRLFTLESVVVATGSSDAVTSVFDVVAAAVVVVVLDADVVVAAVVVVLVGATYAESGNV